MSNRFLILDKPTNILSHDLTARIGRLFGAKAGHAGTLDPQVGGVFVVGLGSYTRLLRFLSGLGKEYVCLAKYPHTVGEKEIKELKAKVGKNAQVPPKQSAVAKRLRYRMLYELEILEVWDNRILFRAKVESGFYMRVLCAQLGAEMEDLRRTAVGPITEDKALNIYKVFYNKARGVPLESYSYSAEELFSFMPAVEVDEEGARRTRHGAPLLPKHVVSWESLDSKYVRIMHKGKMLAVAQPPKHS
ncbi:MAG: hypothetical protein GXN92_03345, partial [Candidatus Micrarchaeota archaeon]|nr:hypothetical protein [Candidatus Micrarchaeota archaeon]